MKVCPKCESTKVIRSFQGGEWVCKNCGWKGSQIKEISDKELEKTQKKKQMEKKVKKLEKKMRRLGY